MASNKEIKEIFSMTPTNQAILLEGIHGIGKSEISKQILESMGYRVVVLFLGQASDAGDIIGLPLHEQNEQFGVTMTTFAPPTWWPLDPNEKVAIFLDELNRGKPEVMQCIMDMVLNRKLNGRDLPKDTRIIGAMNPLSDDGYYQVDSLDPAFLDRWNRYTLLPSPDEWLDYAQANGYHYLVTGFISKNNNYLDPDTKIDNGKSTDSIQVSRRSWERVSNIMNENPHSIGGDTFKTLLLGIIGSGATSAFVKYIRENGKGLTAEKILTKWSSTVEKQVQQLQVQDCIHTNREIIGWLDKNTEILKAGKENAVKYAKNLQSYLDNINAEAMAEFFDGLTNANSDKKSWPSLILKLNKQMADRFFEILNGDSTKEDTADFG